MLCREFLEHMFAPGSYGGGVGSTSLDPGFEPRLYNIYIYPCLQLKEVIVRTRDILNRIDQQVNLAQNSQKLADIQGYIF